MFRDGTPRDSLNGILEPLEPRLLLDSSADWLDWSAFYDGSASGADSYVDMVTGADGYIYATGSTESAGGDVDVVTARYTPDGALDWARRYDSLGAGDDAAEAIALDASGNVIVTGHSWNDGHAAQEFVTLKYTPGGATDWIRHHTGGYPTHDAFAYDVAIDGSGNVYVAGEVYAGAAGDQIATVKYSSAGALLWAREFGSTAGADEARGIAVDNAGRVRVTGRSWALSHFNLAVVAYDDAGAYQWHRYVGGTLGDSVGREVALDDAGNTVVMGDYVSSFSAYKQAIVLKYDSGGTEAWRAFYQSPRSGHCYAYDLALDSAGDAVICGSCYAFWDSQTQYDFFTAKFDATGGDLLWSKGIDGLGSGSDAARSVAVDDANGVYVTGYLFEGASAAIDTVTAKYSADGARLWTTTYDRDPGETTFEHGYAVAVSDGFVIVAGQGDDDGMALRYAQPGEIAGVKFHDADGDGLRDPDEEGLSAWRIFADDNLNGVHDAGEAYTYTDHPDGDYRLLVRPGSHVIAEEPETGWTQTAPGRAAGMVITEIDPANPDRVEIQNTAAFPLWTVGLNVAVSDSYSDINDVNPTTWSLGGLVPAGGALYRSDSSADPNYWGNNIYWNGGNPGWAMIYNDFGQVIDWVGWGWTDEEIASFDVTIGSIHIDGLDERWWGPAVSATAPAGQTLQRNGDVDRHTAADFALAAESIGSPNAGIVTPFRGGVHVVIAESQEVESGNDFGNYQPGAIEGLKWRDDDGDGVHDAGEPGLSGWTVFLDDDRDGVLDAGERSTTTGADGSYHFDPIPTGVYTVAEQLPAGWLQTVPPAQAFYDVDFAGTSPGGIPTGSEDGPTPIALPSSAIEDAHSAAAIVDAAGDMAGRLARLEGTSASGERGLASMTMDIPFELTDGVAAISWRSLVTETPGDMADFETSISVIEDYLGGTNYNLAVRYAPSGQIEVDNRSESVSAAPFTVGEAQFFQLELDLDAATWELSIDGSVAATGDMGYDGDLLKLSFKSFAKWTAGSAAPLAVDDVTVDWQNPRGNSYTVAVGPNETAGEIDFANVEAASIAGVKWRDVNGNGVRDGGEPLLEGWTIFLDDNRNGVLDEGERSTETGTSGEYLFADLLPGLYVVDEAMPEGWIKTYPANDTPHTVVVETGDVVTGKDFGNIESGSISGMKWRDDDGDGEKDAGEPGLSGWRIYIDANHNGAFDTGERYDYTGAGGAYTLDDLPPGFHTVAEVNRTGWTQTHPEAAYTIEVLPGVDVVDVDFGNQPLPGSIGGVKYHDLDGDGARDKGEPGLEGVTIFLDDDGDGALDAGETSTVTGPDGAYSFTGLSQRTYRVAEVPPPDGVRTAPGGRLFALRIDAVGKAPTIVEIDPIDGAALNGFPAPPSSVKDPGYQGLAVGEDRLFFIDGSNATRSILYELDMNTGQTLDSDLINLGHVTGLAYLDGNVALEQHDTDRVYYWDYANDTPNGYIEVAADIAGGLAAMPGGKVDVLFGCRQEKSAAYIFRIDPATGAVGDTFSYPTPFDPIAGGGLAYIDGAIVTSPIDDPATGYRLDPITGAAMGSFTIGGSGDLTGLGGDGARGDSAWRVSLGPGEAATGLDFGNARYGSIGGRKFHDLDGDGEYQPGEPGVPGIVVYLDVNRNGAKDPAEVSTVTDSQGLYSFTGLLPGNHRIAERPKAGWEPDPPGGAWAEVSPFGGQTIDDLHIPNRAVTLGDFDDNGVCNGLDIPGFKAALADPEGWEAATGRSTVARGDFDGNGAFNGLDIPGFKDALTGAVAAASAPLVTDPGTTNIPASLRNELTAEGASGGSAGLRERLAAEMAWRNRRRSLTPSDLLRPSRTRQRSVEHDAPLSSDNPITIGAGPVEVTFLPAPA